MAQMNAYPDDQTDRLSEREGSRLAMLTLMAGLAACTLDTAMVSSSLPFLARDFAVSADTVILAMSAYQAAMVALLIPFAAIADRFGHRGIYIGGMALFTAGGLVCAMSPAFLMLVVARLFQGVGAAAVMSVSIALVRRSNAEGRMGFAMGINAMVVSACLTVGPSLSMLIEAKASWHWLFIGNALIGLAVASAGWATLPSSRQAIAPVRRRTLVLVIIGLSLTAALISGAVKAPMALALMAAFAIATLAMAIRFDLSQKTPILGGDLFQGRVFRLSAATAVVTFGIQGIALICLPFLLQERYPGRTDLHGFLLGVWPICMAIAAPFAGSLSDRIRPAIIGSAGLMLLFLGLVAIALTSAETSALDLSWRIALCGLGFGLFQSPNLRALMSGAPLNRLGTASGIVSGSRLLGQLGGAGLCTILFAAQIGNSSLLFWISAGIAMLGIVLSLQRLRVITNGPAHPVA